MGEEIKSNEPLLARTQYTREYLETLSTPDLQDVADECSCLFGNAKNTQAIRNNLTRTQIIDEVLNNIDIDEGDDIDDEIFSAIETISTDLPIPYNSTEIEVVMLGGAWAFIYWNISTLDKRALVDTKNSERVGSMELRLRVNCFTDDNDTNSIQHKKGEHVDYYDFPVPSDDTSRYFFLPADKTKVRVDLLFFLDGIVDILASSAVIPIPKTPDLLKGEAYWMSEDFPPIIKLSGIDTILKHHFKHNRES